MKKIVLLIIAIFIAFYFIDVEAKEIKSGTYKIVNAKDNSKVLVEKNGNVEIGDNNSGNNTWDVYTSGDNYYIKSHKDNKSLDIKGGKALNGTNIQTYIVNNTKAQKWKLNYANNGYYFIKSLLGNYNIDVKGGVVTTGTNIQIYQNNGTDAQKWKFVRQDENPRVIDDGTYIVKSKSNTSSVLDLAGGKTDNSTNVQINSNNYNWSQIWKLKYEDGYYTISSYLNNSKVLDISGGKLQASSNVQLYQANNSNAQKFIIKDNGDGSYQINSYDGLWSLDLAGGKTTAGTNVQLYYSNGTGAQSFKFEKTSVDSIETGYYTINSKLGSNMGIGVNNAAIFNGKNVDLRTLTNNNYKKWYIKKISGDTYTIANGDNTKYVLDVQGGKTDAGTNVQLYQANNSNAQKWVIKKNDDDTYRIIGVASNKVLDVSGGSSTEGSNIQIYTSNNSNAQKYTLTKTEISKYTRAYDDGKYTIKSNIDKNKVLDISSASKKNNANVQMYQNNNSHAQTWKLEYIEDGVYIIRSMVYPKLVLATNGNNVVSYMYNGSSNQKWYFDKSGDTTTIINMANGKYLNMDSATPTNGTNVSLSDTVTNKNKFVLTNFSGTLKYKGVDLSQHNDIKSWDTLASKIDFAVLRVGYGGDASSQDDKMFKNFVIGCEQNHIPYAVYLYSYAVNVNQAATGDTSEAKHVLRQLKGTNPSLATAVYFDQEDSVIANIKGNKDQDANTIRTNIVNEFCKKIESNGYKCGLYASSSWMTGSSPRINIGSIDNKYKIWVAQWPMTNGVQKYHDFSTVMSSSSTYSRTHKLWQFSSTGNLPGVGTVDLNVGYNIFE